MAFCHPKRGRGLFAYMTASKRAPKNNPKEGKRPELLAPAGGMEPFFAALEAGADAIYVSPRILNARAYGKNFSINQIADLTETAHAKGIKLFVALNSLMKESEIGECLALLAQLEEMAVDGVIVQDLGVAKMARDHFPAIRLHASTLMTIHNSMGVEACKRFGFSRVVLARELTLGEIRQIAQKAQIETEVFVHGAMCFSISGLCRFSSFHGGKSSTRGRCVQPCRRLYHWAGNKGTFFSMDDLCALDFIPALSSAKVTSFKIEGRLKPARYVYHVVRAYRMVMDSGKKDLEKNLDKAHLEIQKAMGRPLTSGFFKNENPRNIISPTRTANTGMFLAKVTRCKNGLLSLSKPIMLKKGDRIRVVMKEKDQQFSTRIQRACEGSSIKIDDLKIPEGFSHTFEGSLLFKTDESKEDGPKWSSLKLQRFKRKDDLEKRKRLAKKIEKGLVGQKTREHHKGSVKVYAFLPDLSMTKSLYKNRLLESIILPLNRKNLSFALRLKPRDEIRRKIVWHLPAVSFEKETATIKGLLEQAKRSGFRRFQISNLWHFALPLKGATLMSSYEFNLINSQSMAFMHDLGVRTPQFSVETDIDNLALSMSHFGKKGAITVYGHIPLFTSRVRHRIYSAKTPVKSQRGESFFWKKEKGFGLLYQASPLSFMDKAHKLAEFGIETWILDLRFRPGKRRKNTRIPNSIGGLKSVFRGKQMNLSSKLH